MLAPVKRFLTPFQSFAKSGSAGGVLLVLAAVLAFAWANSPWSGAYEAMKETPFRIGVGGATLEKPLILWVNDLLMAVFFLLVGLEIKREFLVGELSEVRAATLPILAAIGGMLVPAAIYAAVNAGGAGATGWGIPMATDIAFALGILALLGSRVPVGLKVLLTALAIIDDLGAILVIAIFYTDTLSVGMLGISLAVFAAALAYGRLGGRRLSVFWVLGAVMWFFMLKSHVHATIAGVLLAFAVPMRRKLEPSELKASLGDLFRGPEFEAQEVEVEHVESLVSAAHSPLHNLEHSLQGSVAFAIMPVFALFNAGFTLAPEASLTAPIALGALLGLLLGKPVGVVLFSVLGVRLGIAKLPAGVRWPTMIGLGLLAGIGFTMSLFIANLAFADAGSLDLAKLGVLTASTLAAVAGLAVVAATTRRPA